MHRFIDDLAARTSDQKRSREQCIGSIVKSRCLAEVVELVQVRCKV